MCTCVNMCGWQRRWLTAEGGLALSSDRAPQAKDLVMITRRGSTPRRTSRLRRDVTLTCTWSFRGWNHYNWRQYLWETYCLSVRLYVCCCLISVYTGRLSQLVRYPRQTCLYLGLCRWTAAHFADAHLCSKRYMKSWSQCSAPCGHRVHLSWILNVLNSDRNALE